MSDEKQKESGKQLPKVSTEIKAGPNRRPHDHIGQFNFKVEIEGVTVGATRETIGG